MNRVFRFLLFVICCIVAISCEKDVEEKERFRQKAQAEWLSWERRYHKYSPNISLSRGCHSERAFRSWAAMQIAAGQGNDWQALRVAYLDETIRTPEQLLILATPGNSVVSSPGSSVVAQLENRLNYCTELYINQCIKSGDYKKYLRYWDEISSRFGIILGTPFCPLYYSDVSIVSLDITSTETFFKQRPGASLSSFFRVVLFPSTSYLMDGDGNIVEEGPKGGIWYYDDNAPLEEENTIWKVDDFMSYRPRIIPFGLQMSQEPAERPSSAEFTVTIGYSDGTKCSSILSVDFPY